jgi:signal transduction histidine kinase
MKRRIFLGLLPILILFCAIGIYAVVLFKQLGGKIDQTLRENYRSVVAGEQMKESLERMDSGLFFELVNEQARGRGLFDQNESGFDKALQTEEHNITLPGEGELAQKLRELFNKYVTDAAQFREISDLQQKRSTYFSELLPLATQIKDRAQDVIAINEQNMLAQNQEARRVSDASTRYMFLAGAIAIAAGLFFAWRLQRSIVQSIRNLTAGARELGEGNLDQLVPVSSRDEFGELAESFNKLASKLRIYRQATTDQILQARQTTEIALSAFPDPVIAFSLNREIELANPAAEKLMLKLGRQLPAGLTQEVDKILQGSPDYLPTSFSNSVLVRLHGHDQHFLPRILGMRDESGNLFGAVLVLQDVTRFRLMDELKTNLVSTVSHELKTPLTSVRMGLHLLLDERIGTLNEKQTELLLAAREDSERLLRIIEDLLDLGRIEADNSRQTFETIPADSLLNSMRDDFLPAVEAKGCHLKLVVGSNLPPVAVDARQIHHVFSNLVSNAIRHSPPGEEIVLEAKLIRDVVRFSVIDHGPGVPLEYQAKVFDRFYRVPGTEQKGVGLGLAIAREIVVAHGGTIGLKSQPGSGSEFYFDLPIVKSAAA